MAEEAQKSGHHAPPSTSELMSSSKVLAEAAQSGFSKEGPGFDKAKVAGSAEDILEAGKNYGKLDDKAGVGQYVDKAEGYLHQYHPSSDSSTTPATAPHGGEGEEKDTEKKSSGGGGGAGDTINTAKGLFSK